MALRLLVVSLVVGALLMWLDIRPWEVLRAVERLFLRLWAMGFDAVALQRYPQVERIEHVASSTRFNARYLATKASKLGHLLPQAPAHSSKP